MRFTAFVSCQKQLAVRIIDLVHSFAPCEQASTELQGYVRMLPDTPIIRKKGFSDLVLKEILALIGELMQSETLLSFL